MKGANADSIYNSHFQDRSEPLSALIPKKKRKVSQIGKRKKKVKKNIINASQTFEPTKIENGDAAVGVGAES